MSSAFFLGRRRAVVTGPYGLDRALDRIYALLARLAADPSDYYHLPRDRIVELSNLYNVREFIADPSFATMLLTELKDDGDEVKIAALNTLKELHTLSSTDFINAPAA